MRSTNRTIVVYKHPKIGPLPNFLHLAQRHFEKDKPITGYAFPAAEITLQVPVDLAMLVVGEEAIKDIDSITITYCRKGVVGDATA